MLAIDLSLGLLVLFVALLIITWTTQIRTGTPTITTPRRVAAEMIRIAELQGTETVYDIGAGDGRLLIALKRSFPGLRAVGYENALGVWMLGMLRILFAGESVRFRCRDALKAEYGDADVIFLYVTPEVMALLEKKFDRELRPGARVVSHQFRFPGKSPVRESAAPGWARQKRIYLYRW